MVIDGDSLILILETADVRAPPLLGERLSALEERGGERGTNWAYDRRRGEVPESKSSISEVDCVRGRVERSMVVPGPVKKQNLSKLSKLTFNQMQEGCDILVYKLTVMSLRAQIRFVF